MATKKDDRPWYERWWDWATEGEDKPPVAYVDPKTGKARTNVAKMNPRTGRRAGEYPTVTGVEAFSNIKNNIGIDNWAQAARGFVRGIANMPKDIPEGLMGMMSAYRGWIGSHLSDSQYYNLLMMPQTGNPEADAYIRQQMAKMPKPSLAEIRNLRQKDNQAATAIANSFSYRDKNGQFRFDTDGFIRSATQDPAGTGVALLETVRSGGAGAAKKLTKVAQAATPGSRTATVATALKKAAEATSKGAGAAAWVANPLVPGTSAVLRSAPVRGAVTAAVSAVRGRQSIYQPEFLKEWTPFKEQAEERLRAGGATDEMLASPEAQQRIFDMFNQQTNGRFADPFNPDVSAAMRNQGINPEQYASPHLGSVIEDTVNKKRGITPAIINEGALRAAGAQNVTRSAATGEAPGRLFANQEGAARSQTEQQMGEAFSGRFAPPQGGMQPTINDVAGDLIDTNIQRRNSFQQSYANAASNDGVYNDPNDFLSTLDQEAADIMRQRGIDPDELSTNPDVFRNSNRASQGLRQNIANHGSHVPPVQQMGIDGQMYTYNRQHNVWLDPASQPARPAMQQILNSDPVSQRAISSPPPTPVNRLSLENIEIERRRLNSEAERAYQSGLESGDWRNYNAITAYRDALDNTSINLAPDFSGDANAAIRSLQDGRTQYRQWRQSTLDSDNPVVREASGAIISRTAIDPNTNTYSFSNTPGARQAVADVLDGKLVGSGANGNIAPPRSVGNTNPAEIYSSLQNSLSPTGQQALAGYVRGQGYGRPGATPDSIAELDAAYNGNGINLLSPEERNFLNINLQGRATASPGNVPRPDPYNFNPFSEANKDMSLTEKAATAVKPFVKGGLGYGIGTAIGGPGLGNVLGGAGFFEGPAGHYARQFKLFQNEQGGAPKYTMGAPETRLPLAFGAAYGSQQAQQAGLQRQQAEDEAALRQFSLPPSAPSAPAPAPMAGPTREDAGMSRQPSAADIMASEDAAFLKSLEPQPQYRGGRAAYNTGGAVSSIEPLVRNLVNKAGTVKKMSNKSTEPLLNEHDNAIASALEVAQKAI